MTNVEAFAGAASVVPMLLQFAPTNISALSIQDRLSNTTPCASRQAWFLSVFAVHHPPPRGRRDAFQLCRKRTIGRDADALCGRTVVFVEVSSGSLFSNWSKEKRRHRSLRSLIFRLIPPLTPAAPPRARAGCRPARFPRSGGRAAPRGRVRLGLVRRATARIPGCSGRPSA